MDKRLNEGGITVGVPNSGRNVTIEWAVQLATLSYPVNTSISIAGVRGKKVEEARNWIVESALEQGSKYLFFLDDDVQPPKFAPRQLIYDLEQDKQAMVATGIYVTKREPVEPLIFKPDGGGGYWDWKVGQVFEIDSCGAGCMMIKTEVFSHLQKPYFDWTDKAGGHFIQNQMSEDIYFCKLIRDAGFKILADGKVLCSHWDNETGIPYAIPSDSYPLRKEETK